MAIQSVGRDSIRGFIKAPPSLCFDGAIWDPFSAVAFVTEIERTEANLLALVLG
jgi:hypothetical protein